MRPKLLIALLVIFPINLFFIARQAASWRPKFVTKLLSVGGRISPDGKRFVYLNKKSELEVMDLASQKKEFSVRVPQKSTPIGGSFQWTPDSKTITATWNSTVEREGTFSGDYVGDIGVLLYELGGKVKVFKDKYILFTDDYLGQVRFSADKKTLWLASCSNYRVWDLKSGKFLKRGWDEGGRDSSIPYFGGLSTDSRTFFEIGQSGFRKLDTSTNKVLPAPKELDGLADGELEFSPDSTIIIHENLMQQTTGEPPLRIVETKTGNFLWAPPVWPKFSPDSKSCLLSFPDRIEKRDARTGKLQGKFPPVAKNTHPFQIINDEAFYSIDDKGNLYRSRLK